MGITITWQTVITLFAGLSAVVGIATLFAKLVRWVDKQKKQDEDIRSLKAQHEEDMTAIKHEQTLVVYGVLACLKGLQEKGCNGPVTEAIKTLEKHLNKEAHK